MARKLKVFETSQGFFDLNEKLRSKRGVRAAISFTKGSQRNPKTKG